MLVGEAPRVRTLAGCFDLDEAYQRRIERDGVIRPRLEVGKRCFAYRGDLPFWHAEKFCDIDDQIFEWRSQLVFGGARNCCVAKLGLCPGTEVGDYDVECFFQSREPAMLLLCVMRRQMPVSTYAQKLDCTGNPASELSVPASPPCGQGGCRWRLRG